MRKAFLLLFAAILMIKPISLQAKKGFCYEDYKIPDEYISYFEEYGVRANICPELLESIAFYESRFIKDVSNENCVGIMQIDIKIHSDRIRSFGYEVDDMYDPEKNIEIACDILSDLYEEYGDNNYLVILRYGGRKKEILNYKKTGQISEYASKILWLSEKYERFHNK